MAEADDDARQAAVLVSRCSGKAVLLITSTQNNQIWIVNMRKLETMLDGLGVEFEKVDGADAANKDLRTAMWAASGARSYPQLFLDGKPAAGNGTLDDIQDTSARLPLTRPSAAPNAANASPPRPRPSDQPRV